MLELVRVFLGYCHDCRQPKVVGEFKLPGWHHAFNICDTCMQKKTDKLVAEEDMLVRRQFQPESRI
jgi:hypothetical protein